MCTVAFDVISSKTQLFGSNLHLEMCYQGPSPSKPAPPPTAFEGRANVLCVQGLPESMLSNPSLVCEAMKHFIKQTTGFEATHCEIVDGIGYLTFADPSGTGIVLIFNRYLNLSLLAAAQAIVPNPPAATFMAGSTLSMSLNSPVQNTQPEAPPTEKCPPNIAWRPSAGEQFARPREMGSPPVSEIASPSQERSFTALVGKRPPVAWSRCHHVSDDKEDGNLHSPSGGQTFGNMGGGQNLWSNNSCSQFSQQQSPQSSLGQMPHSVSSPGGLGNAQAQYGWQLPFNPSHQYMPEQSYHSVHRRQPRSVNYQLGHNLPVQSEDTWHGSKAQPLFQPVSTSQQGMYEVCVCY